MRIRRVSKSVVQQDGVSNIPTSIVHAAAVCTITGRLALNPCAMNRFAGNSECFDVLGVVVGKDLEQLPKTVRLMSVDGKKTAEHILCARVSAKRWVVHRGPLVDREGKVQYNLNRLQIFDVEKYGAVASTGSSAKRLKVVATAKQKSPSYLKLPQDLSTYNSGRHKGIKCCVAKACFLAELERARVDKRAVVLTEALAKFELNPFLWRRGSWRRVFLLWSSGEGLYHADSVQTLSRLTKYC